jgi:hypothetical protein
MDNVQRLAIQNLFGRMKAARICRGIERMNKTDYDKNMKIINQMCKRWASMR